MKKKKQQHKNNNKKNKQNIRINMIKKTNKLNMIKKQMEFMEWKEDTRYFSHLINLTAHDSNFIISNRKLQSWAKY